MSEDKFTTYELAQRIVSDVRRGDMGVVGLEAALNALASQVCEQREKEVNDKWERDVGHDWDAIGHALKMPSHIPRRLTEILQAIEAAELALQKAEENDDKLHHQLCQMQDEIAELVCTDLADWSWKDCVERVKAQKAALQAKEQEVAEICEAHNYGVNILTELAAAKLEAAQARQQAVADLIPQLEKRRQDAIARADKWEDAKEGDKAHYWLGVAYGQGSAIYLLNSLTPSPALTPKIERRVGKERRDPAGTQPYSWKNGRKGERRKKPPALTKEK